mmetsp:Transcript_29870/g.29028  ORF Transcript_29870/g.29028 Transcript_29870/m.29028 type:complete len:124 (-) Transcript_29870:384-755(-)
MLTLTSTADLLRAYFEIPSSKVDSVLAILSYFLIYPFCLGWFIYGNYLYFKWEEQCRALPDEEDKLKSFFIVVIFLTYTLLVQMGFHLVFGIVLKKGEKEMIRARKDELQTLQVQHVPFEQFT